MTVPLREVHDRLLTAYGPQGWWPADSPFEVMVGAVLVQNTAWKNVCSAIQNLRDSDLLTPERIDALSQMELEELVRPAGYFRVKARRLRNLVRFMMHHYGGMPRAMAQSDPQTLREQLLAVNGVGPETADSILLYACQHPVFVVDTYTHRVLARHGWIEEDADYHAIQDFFQTRLEQDVALYNELHALLVRVGHLHCRRTPKCASCPLEDLLPEGGPWPAARA